MIKEIVFDFGGVLYNYNHNQLMKKIGNKLGVSEDLMGKIWKRSIIKYEKGEISEEQFWKLILDKLKKNIDQKILHNLVIDHFQPIKGTLEILKKLKLKYSIGLISNQTTWINNLNVKYNFKKLFKLIIISKDIALRKPQKEIFELYISKSGLKPEEIIYIDDSIEYEKAVKKVGMKFLHYQNSEQLENDLNKFGVSI